MRSDMSWGQFLEKLCKDPDFAALWAESIPNIDLAVNVSRLRQARGMTQKQLAEAAGLKQPRITDIERTESNPTLLTSARIANALGVRVERLFADTRVHAEAEPAPETRAEPAADKAVRRRRKVVA